MYMYLEVKNTMTRHAIFSHYDCSMCFFRGENSPTIFEKLVSIW